MSTESFESFESVMEAAMPLLSGDCVFESCPDENDDCMHCAIHMADRLRAAHDREIAQAQRSTDTKHKEVTTRLYNLRFYGGRFGPEMSHVLGGCEANEDTDTITGSYSRVLDNLDRLREAYDRDMQDARECMDKLGYHRGYCDGQHSMDAEHRAISMRLRGLRFDGGSHENLSRVAYAIYPCATGWTCESVDGLRDRLIDLMGGVSDDTCDSQCRGACADCDGGDSGEPKEVEHERPADDCAVDSRGGDGGGDLHMAGVTYDVLWNERHEAVRVLRKLLDRNTSIWNTEISIALGLNIFANNAAVCRRLIHLLGGDQPSGIDVLRAMNADGTCHNDVPTSSITDELREWANSDVWSCRWEEFKAIADRIDEQFGRICQQQEAVLQSTIDGMVKEYEHDRLLDQLRIEKLEKQRDEARAKLDAIRDALDG